MKLTDFLAVYAAFLSSVVFLWNVLRARPKILVKVVHGAQKVGDDYVNGASISVQNPSAQTVHITNISLAYPYKKIRLSDRVEHLWRRRRFPRRLGWCHTSLSNYNIDDKCPVPIEPGMSHMVFVPREALEQVLESATSRRFVAVVQDALWRDTYSREFEYPAIRKKADRTQG